MKILPDYPDPAGAENQRSGAPLVRDPRSAVSFWNDVFLFLFFFIIGRHRLEQVVVALADDSFQLHGEISERE